MRAPSIRGLDRYLASLAPNVYRYGNASHAFKDVLLFLRSRSRASVPNVVMPSFIPAKLHRAVLAAGYQAKFYDVGPGCRPDPQEAEDLIDEATTSLFVIHYFGHPAEIHAFAEIASRKSIALIEDCAHVLLGSLDGRMLGTFGDFSIFSPRKMLQLSDGGFLLINSPAGSFTPTCERRIRSLYTLTRLALSRGKRLSLWATSGRDILHLAGTAPTGFIDPKRPPELRVQRMSYATAFYSRLTDIARNSATRKTNYVRLSHMLRDFTFLKPLYRCLPHAWTPYSLPMVVDRHQRARLHAELLKHGVSCGLGWPESPAGGAGNGTRELAQRVIEFPVHPLLLESQFGRIADACKSFGRSYSLSAGGSPLARDPFVFLDRRSSYEISKAD